MQRFFLEKEQLPQADRCITLEGRVHHQLYRVLRAQVGEQFVVCDGHGQEAIATLVAIDAKQAILECGAWAPSRGEPTLQVTVAQGLPKGDKWEWVLQKGTELGASAFWPLAAHRSVVRIEPKKVSAKLLRWQAIVQEAAEQSRRGLVPRVEAPLTLQDVSDKLFAFDVALVLDERGIATPLAQQLKALKAQAPQRILVLIGPEGGWEEQELALLTSRGVRRVHLGTRILRTETAAIAAVAALMYEFGEWGEEHA